MLFSIKANNLEVILSFIWKKELYDTLNNLPSGKTAKIQSLVCSGSIRRRLLDLGLVTNTRVTPILKSPSRGSYCF